METFAAAAVSLTISIVLFIRKTRNELHVSLAVLCLAICTEKIGVLGHEVFGTDIWRALHYLGLLAISPLAAQFCRTLVRHSRFLPKRGPLIAGVVSCVLAFLLLGPLFEWPHVRILLYGYTGCVLVFCFAVLARSAGESTPGAEKTRLTYVSVACGIACVFGVFDILHGAGVVIPPLFDVALAALLYFLFIVVVHAHLPELYDIMLQALFVLIVVMVSTAIFYGAMFLSVDDLKFPFIRIVFVSFLIVIMIEPVKLVLKKVFDHFLAGRKKVSTSLYMDDEEERTNSVLLEEMASGLAHEIRNPLGAIKGAAQYLKTEVDAPGSSRIIDIIIEETERLNAVVSQFLNYATPHVINASVQDINRIVRKVIDLIKATNLPDNITVDAKLNDTLPRAKVDGEQMLQVVLNMALNAIDAMPEGGTLTFETSPVKDKGAMQTEIVVRDTGRGISKENMGNIFKPFFTTKKKGTGLGLPICRRIITRHGGRISVQSNPGDGTTFYIRI
jgi:two-component system sensor histidine kinase HydH